jgi:hypothetical protein
VICMKKYLVLILLALFVLPFAACEDEDEDKETTIVYDVGSACDAITTETPEKYVDLYKEGSCKDTDYIAKCVYKTDLSDSAVYYLYDLDGDYSSLDDLKSDCDSFSGEYSEN